jgi:hypothetical protein
LAYDLGGSAAQSVLHRIQRSGMAAVLVLVAFAREPPGGWTTSSVLSTAALQWGTRLLRAATHTGTMGPQFTLT